jgi:hypothetical protein
MRYKKIIGGSEADAENKFPWLKNAKFYDAEIDITMDVLIWQDGIWKYGIWVGGVWEDGVWEGGTWKGGIWKGGIWKGGIWKGGVWHSGNWEGGNWERGNWQGGRMWSNSKQSYEEIVQKDGKFIERPPATGGEEGER